jgi:cell division protein FtsL
MTIKNNVRTRRGLKRAIETLERDYQRLQTEHASIGDLTRQNKAQFKVDMAEYRQAIDWIKQSAVEEIPAKAPKAKTKAA